MKTILCYGDSNTWGYDPATQDRFPRDVRWTGVLRNELGDQYIVIEEGLNGRTTVWDDPIEGYKNGKEYLIPCLESHRPLDLVVIMLGTNDLKMRFSVPTFDIANSAGVLVDIVRSSAAGPDGRPPRVLLIAPPPLARLTDFADMFEGATPKALTFAKHYRRVAEEKDCYFLDAGAVIVSSNLDGIHFEADQHAKLGLAVAGHVRAALA
jgi:lysophospholipase L1-like esterase